MPLDGFKALQGVHGPQKFQIHRAYGATDRLPSGAVLLRATLRLRMVCLIRGSTHNGSVAPSTPRASMPPPHPAAHTCFNQLDLIEYESKDQLRCAVW